MPSRIFVSQQAFSEDLNNWIEAGAKFAATLPEK